MLYVYSMYLKSIYRQFVYDLPRQLVLLICSATLLSLFFFIFNDFINTKLNFLSEEWLLTVQNYTRSIIAVFFSGWLSQILTKNITDEASFPSLMRRLGDSNNQILLLQIFVSMSLLFFFYFIFHLIVDVFLLKGSIGTFSFPFYSCMISITFCGFFIHSKLSKTAHSSIQFVKQKGQHKPFIIFAALFRIEQIIFKNRFLQLITSFGFICKVLGIITFATYQNFYISSFFSFASGLFFSMAFSFQLKTDMKLSWFEKQKGMTHIQFMKIYLCSISLFFLTYLGIISIFYIAFLVVFKAAWIPSIIELLQLVFLPGLSLLSFFLVMFQIDAQKPIFNIISSSLVSLFVSTAAIATPLGYLCSPFLIYYAFVSQKDRYCTTAIQR